jgi:pimeloyl-ACP methyl ester carboxylesterase
MPDSPTSIEIVPFETGVIAAPEGLPVRYTVYGDRGREAAHLILLHESDISSSTSLIDLVAPYYRVTVLESDRASLNPDTSAPTHDDLTDTIFALCNRFQIGQAVIIGVGQGGRPALLFALAHQERVAALVTVDTALSAEGFSTTARTQKSSARRFAGLMASLSKRTHGKSPIEAEAGGYPDIDPTRLAAIRCDALVVSHETGSIRPEHARLIADSLHSAEIRFIPARDQGAEADDLDAVNEVIRCWLIDEC